MKNRLWLILGATSIIAEQFAHIAAENDNALLLVGRDGKQLRLIAGDLFLRHHVHCEILTQDLSDDISLLLHLLENDKREMDILIAHSQISNNEKLDLQIINDMLQTNVVNTSQIIHAYLQRKQKKQRLLFLSSVAACRGRAKNSLYGGSKAAIEIYLEGLQQAAEKHQTITIARLGFIDTKQTYGMPGIFYAAAPEKCAKACWRAVQKQKSLVYFPRFWRLIMGVIKIIPGIIYQRMKGV